MFRQWILHNLAKIDDGAISVSALSFDDLRVVLVTKADNGNIDEIGPHGCSNKNEVYKADDEA